MSFLYPLGLLGLIGIPILIIIYIIKSKYTEQTVSSTYLWLLSERFLKRKNPISKLAGIISLILQILAVALISLIIAHPVITVPNAAHEYCFILDASGSMSFRGADGKTRFEAGKEEIVKVIDSSIDGCRYSLVYVGDDTNVIFEKLENKEQAISLVEDLQPSYNEADFTDAIGVAQGYFNEYPGVRTYLVTDIAYKDTQNIELVNVGGDAENYAVGNVSYTQLGKKLTVVGSVISYCSDAELTVNLYLDGSETPSVTQNVAVSAGEPTPVALEVTANAFSSIRVEIANADALMMDNESMIYDVKSENSYKTLIVSDRPLFLEAAISTVINAQIDVIDPKDYRGQRGYGLYVFDSVNATLLTDMPRDGAVWLINVDGSVEGSGYSVQGSVTFSGSELLERHSSTSSAAQTLTQGLSGDPIHVTGYIKCGFYRNFTTLLSYKGNPVLFAGTNTDGNREVVFAFDIHNSDLPLLYDYTVLIRNLVKYSFPDMMDRTSYECGEEAAVNVIANCDSIRVESPLGNISYLDTSVAVDNLRLNEVGVYKIIMTVAGSPREIYVYSAMTGAERVPIVEGDSIALQGKPVTTGFDGKYDPFVVLMIALAVVFLADWMVYCYEKYQLR
ncbi:MAG: VWA domain-containing protein [Clostridia bacterium]|nr:VWA domain-containing protein [Clostridia bacterium]